MSSPLIKLSLALTLSLGGCIGEIDSPDELDQDVDIGAVHARSFNARSFNAMTLNALITNPTTLKALVENPLSSETFSDPDLEALRFHASEVNTLGFFEYLVSCALPSGHLVELIDPRDNSGAKFYGSLGLCPDWAAGSVAGNNACTELVSACLMSRINAFGHEVGISIRGVDTYERALPFEKPLTADTHNALSTMACSSTSYGPNANCGWEAGFVGACIAGQTVTISEPSACPASAWGNYDAYRICRGQGTCDRGTPEHVNSYWTCYADPAPTTFTCPSSGAFTIMERSLWGDHRKPSIRPDASGYGVYHPAHELQVFKYREAAFFGEMFDSKSLGLQTRVVPEYLRWPEKVQYRVFDGDTWGPWSDEPPRENFVAFRSMFACHSDQWDYDTTYEKLRLCAGDTSTACAAMHVGNCSSLAAHPELDSSLEPFFASGLCGIEDSKAFLGDRDYDDCVAPGVIDEKTGSERVWRYPITTHLMEPCEYQKGGPNSGDDCRDYHLPIWQPWTPIWNFSR